MGIRGSNEFEVDADMPDYGLVIRMRENGTSEVEELVLTRHKRGPSFDEECRLVYYSSSKDPMAGIKGANELRVQLRVQGYWPRVGSSFNQQMECSRKAMELFQAREVRDGSGS